jgi:hypothetical protein
MSKAKTKVRLRAQETRASVVRKIKPYIAGNPSRSIGASTVRRTYYLASEKLGGKFVKTEALSEDTQARILETDNRVLTYQHQPEPIAYRLDDEDFDRSYTPDFEARYRDGTREYFECKTREFVDTPENQALFKAVRAALAPTGVPLSVVVLEDLRAGYRLANAERLLKCRKLVPDPAVVQLVTDIFRFNPPKTLGQLVRQLDREMWMNGMEFRAPVLHGTDLSWGPAEPTINQLKGMAMRNVFCIDLFAEAVSEFSAVYPAIPNTDH